MSTERHREVFVRHDAELDALGYFQYLHERNPDAAVQCIGLGAPAFPSPRYLPSIILSKMRMGKSTR